MTPLEIAHETPLYVPLGFAPSFHGERSWAPQEEFCGQPDARRHSSLIVPCYHPIEAWYARERNPSGKRSLVFSPAKACGLPPIQIACGQCIGCRLERARQWAVRVMHEAQFYEQTAFLTFTYSPEHLPADGSLDVRDLQLFFKRYRQHLVREHRRLGRAGDPPRVRFFACGEYGDGLLRPHYHAIVFGDAFLDSRKRWKRGSAGDQIFVSDVLDKLWGLGDCYIGTVSLQSAGYVARYTVKKVTGDRAEAHYGHLKPEFMVCSKGIGRKWFEAFEADLADDRVVFKGRRMRLPKFYDKLLPEDELAARKVKRQADAAKLWANNTPERLAIREEVTKARTSTLKRNL